MCLNKFYRLEIHSLMIVIFDPACELLPPIDEGTIKTPTPKMSSLLVFNRVYRLEVQSVMLVFSTPFVYCCPSTFSLTACSPPPPIPNKRTVYTDSVWLCGEWGWGWGL